jgi:hypothetical protein
MGDIRNTLEGDINYKQNFIWKNGEIKDRRVHGRIILNRILEECARKIWVGLNWTRTGCNDEIL